MTAYSFSSISTYLQCPRRFQAQYIEKRVRDTGSEASRHGERVHKQLELYVKGESDELPDQRPKDNILDALRRAGAKAELKVAVSYDFEPRDFWAKDVMLRGLVDVQVEMPGGVVVVDWKGLAVDTPIPTPDGWSRMGDLAAGDQVFDLDGKTCRVLARSQVKTIPCFEVKFDDGNTVVCDEEHLWTVWPKSAPADAVLETLSVRELAPGDLIPVATPIGRHPSPDARLPVDPYVLGLWLADGKHTSGEICKPDAFVWEEVQRRGYGVSEYVQAGRCRSGTVKGLRRQLRGLGLLGNKHIPAAYLRASYSQRIDLLRGLMDGGGNANPARKQAVFTTCDKALSDQLYELLMTLGLRANQATTRQFGFGKEVTAYPLAFRPQRFNPFSLPRKARKIEWKKWGPGRSYYRRIVSVVAVPSVPTRCISVDSPTRTFLCGRGFIPTHNTGKKRDNSLQGSFYAAMMSAYHPGRRVQVVFDYLDKGRCPPIDYKPKMRDEVKNLVEMVDGSTAYPPRPTPLCGWCPVTDCEFNTKGERR